MREADDECFRGALIVVDTRDALRESGDLIGPLGNGSVHDAQVVSLKDLVERKAGTPGSPRKPPCHETGSSRMSDP